jgi:hypothetical protein
LVVDDLDPVEQSTDRNVAEIGQRDLAARSGR